MSELITPLPSGFAVAVPITNILLFTATLTPAIVNANTAVEQTFAVTNLPASVTAGVLIVSKPTAQAGLGVIGARVSAGNVIILFWNVTAGNITPTAGELYSFLLVN